MPTDYKALYEQAQADLKVLRKAITVLRADYDKVKVLAGDWHTWGHKIEGVPKKLLNAAKKLLGL